MSHTRLLYRTFETLMNSVRGDLKTLSLEGMIDEGELINLTRRINFDLGLKINPSRVKLLEICNGEVSLPRDFSVLNHVTALPCSVSDGCGDLVFGTASIAQEILPVPQVSLPCATDEPIRRSMSLQPGITELTHDFNSTDITVHLSTPNGIEPTDILVRITSPCTIQLISSSAVPLLLVDIHGPLGSAVSSIGSQPTKHIRLTSLAGWLETLQQSYPIVPLDIIRKPRLESLGYSSRRSCWLETETLRVSSEGWGYVLLDYQGEMENDLGELLTLDHPKVNEYYEYGLKERILENLILNGEPETTRYQIVQAKLREARTGAMVYTRSLDYSDLKEAWQASRRSAYQKYFAPFLSR